MGTVVRTKLPDWENSWACYRAIAATGFLYEFDRKPILTEYGWLPRPGTTSVILNGRYDTTNWEHSLECRCSDV